jgi:hypothetical protein
VRFTPAALEGNGGTCSSTRSPRRVAVFEAKRLSASKIRRASKEPTHCAQKCNQNKKIKASVEILSLWI